MLAATGSVPSPLLTRTASTAPPFEIYAERLSLSPSGCVAQGHVVLTSPGFRVDAERVEIDPSARVKAEGLRFTPCTCASGQAPSWSISARRAEIDPGQGVRLVWPVLRVGGLGVLALPRGYWPLGERRSGLLMPMVRTHPAVGLEIGQPVYFVLGPSWDLALTPRLRTTRGLGGAVMLRNHPAVGTEGQLQASFAYDQGVPDGRGWRWGGDDGQARYRVWGGQSLGRWTARVDVLGDAGGFEFADAFAQRQAEWALSRLTFQQDAGPVRISGGAQLRQDLRPLTYPGQRKRNVGLWTDPIARAVRQRFGELRLDVLRLPLVGPPTLGIPMIVSASGRASVQAFGALSSVSPSFFRADLRPAVEQSAHLPLGLSLSSELSLRVTTWVGQAETTSRWAPRLAGALRQTLTRRFGRWRHTIRPEIGAMYIPMVGGRPPPQLDTLDDIDALGPVAQLRLRLASTLTDGRRRVFIDLSSGRDFRPPGRAADGLGWAPIVAVGGGRWSDGRRSVRGRLSLAIDGEGMAGTATLEADGQAWGVGSALAVLADRPPAAWFIAAEEQLPSVTLAAQRQDYGVSVPWRAQTALAGWARATVGRGWTLEARLAFSWRETRAELKRAYPSARFHSVLQGGRIRGRYVSTCGCWSLAADAGIDRDLGGLALGVRLVLGSGLRP